MMKFEELLKIETITELKPEVQLNTIGLLFDLSFDNGNIEGIEHAFSLSKQINIDNLEETFKPTLYYNLSNGWSYLRKLKYHQTNEDWLFKSEELVNEIFFLRKAISTQGFNSLDKVRQCQILTNLGNSFSYIGRFVEAQEYWNKALAIMPNFAMALANKGNGLYYYGYKLFDEIHRSIFALYAYHFLEQSLTDEQYLEGGAKQFFQNLYEHIKSNAKGQDLELPDLNNYDLGQDENLKEYRTWCLEHTLFINPLNDLGNYSIASHDCLNLPTLIIPSNKPPVCINIFNQVKQEFATARYSFYQSQQNNKIHNSDEDVPLVDTFETAVYSYYLEQMKIAFRLSYSILDKIAYLLNDYLELGIAPHMVSFKSLWYSDKRGRDLRPFFNQSQNWALRGLYWLSKDLYEKENDFDAVLAPEAREIAIIRNYIEHKGFKVTTDENSLWESTSDISYTILYDNFESKTLSLLKLARAAIMYLSIAISIEEEKKKDEDIKFGFVPTTFIPKYSRT